MCLVRKVIEEYLKNGNWHIGDGADDCSGHDDEGMEKEREEIIKKLEVLEDEIEELESDLIDVREQKELNE